MAICEEGIVSCRFKEGGYDNFSYKIYLESTIDTLITEFPT